MDLLQVLKKPIITEKSMQAATLGKYTFAVARGANKDQIAAAVTEAFKVHPILVRTINVKGYQHWSRGFRKKTRMPNWKKAVVTLKEGEKIEVFEVSK